MRPQARKENDFSLDKSRKNIIYFTVQKRKRKKFGGMYAR
jgi:hypothetical protein